MLLLGALLILAFPAPNLEFLAWFGLVPGLVLIVRSPTAREGGIRAWWLGAGYLIAAWYWMAPEIGPAVLLVGAVGALVAILIVDGLHYFQYTAVKFNHDVIQLPLWALAGYSFHAALKRGHIGYWLLLGIAFVWIYATLVRRLVGDWRLAVMAAIALA